MIATRRDCPPARRSPGRGPGSQRCVRPQSMWPGWRSRRQIELDLVPGDAAMGVGVVDVRLIGGAIYHNARGWGWCNYRYSRWKSSLGGCSTRCRGMTAKPTVATRMLTPSRAAATGILSSSCPPTFQVETTPSLGYQLLRPLHRSDEAQVVGARQARASCPSQPGPGGLRQTVDDRDQLFPLHSEMPRLSQEVLACDQSTPRSVPRRR